MRIMHLQHYDLVTYGRPVTGILVPRTKIFNEKPVPQTNFSGKMVRLWKNGPGTGSAYS